MFNTDIGVGWVNRSGSVNFQVGVIGLFLGTLNQLHVQHLCLIIRRRIGLLFKTAKSTVRLPFNSNV